MNIQNTMKHIEHSINMLKLQKNIHFKKERHLYGNIIGRHIGKDVHMICLIKKNESYELLNTLSLEVVGFTLDQLIDNGYMGNKN